MYAHMGCIKDDLIISSYLHRWRKKNRKLQTHGISHVNLKDQGNIRLYVIRPDPWLIISIA